MPQAQEAAGGTDAGCGNAARDARKKLLTPSSRRQLPARLAPIAAIIFPVLEKGHCIANVARKPNHHWGPSGDR